ncbi:uncharacterized protein N7511_011291 [Penicillium nucicola]|uniref:uncharacterized protein n=1 Tax=Penicillium nucicola TaxID=1850975 RepID=UPI0025451F26|nr:uncharacterized protein N7511_011291 [Penicillium nucicola]KAJ5742559.1 hypothetical protein N7511_011291 [Penicillium nucicola]
MPLSDCEVLNTGYSHQLPIKSCSPRSRGLNPYQKLLRRFYEPLFLLETLGQARGEHNTAVPMMDPRIAHRRKFLQNLSYICDFEKGGNSCTALGVEERDTYYKFWVASNSVNRKVVEFLESALSTLKIAGSHGPTESERDKIDFVDFCIRFASSRVKKETQSLFRAVKACYSKQNQWNTDPCWYLLLECKYKKLLMEIIALDIWLDSILAHKDSFSLCKFAYENRHSKFVDILTFSAQNEEKKIGPQGRMTSFAIAKHYLGRLAAHIRAPQQLFEDAETLDYMLESCKVDYIEPIPSVPQPIFDSQTTLEGILYRMLKQNDPERLEIERKLIYMNMGNGILEKLNEQYQRCVPQVHAEVQVLEHFHKKKLHFVDADRYIACSKPSCVCCEMYFKYHPARMDAPECHRKVWIKWSPPLVKVFTKNLPDFKQQRQIINKMTEDIRSDVIAQVLE